MTKLRELLEDVRDDLGNHHLRVDPKFLTDEDLDFIEERIKPLIHKLEGNEAGALEYYNEEKQKVAALVEIARKVIERPEPSPALAPISEWKECADRLRSALREIAANKGGS